MQKLAPLFTPNYSQEDQSECKNSVAIPRLYPPSVWKGDGNTGGFYVGLPFRVVLHTTETVGLPSYDRGAVAPHLTYDPVEHVWTQHSKLTTAARVLRNPTGGVQTNRANALQVEIICYSNKHVADQADNRLWVGDLDKQALADLRDFIKWTGVAFKWRGTQALSYTQANSDNYRFTDEQWNAWDGVCSHQDVPENTHWDTGALRWDILMGDNEIMEDGFMYPIRRGDGASTQNSHRAEDVRFYQHKLAAIGYAEAGASGVADQQFLDVIFSIVGSAKGGSYFSGEEAAIFDILFAGKFNPVPMVVDSYSKEQADVKFAKKVHKHTMTFS